MSLSSVPTTSESPLLRLPLELLLRITYHLTTPELGHVRLTCRQAEAALFRSFAREFFRRKRFMLTEFSLRALVDISKSRLGQHLQFLEIGLEKMPDAEGMRDSVPAKQAYYVEKMFAEHNAFAETGGDALLLAEALTNLKSLEDVVVRDTMSYTRHRDGLHVPWKSYGAMTALAENGLDRSPRSVVQEMPPYKTLLVVLQALASADARINGIEVLLRNRCCTWLGAYHVPNHLRPKLAPVLRHLKKLHLSSGNVFDQPHSVSKTTQDLGVRKFLGFVPNLVELRFNGHVKQDDETLKNFLKWLSLPAALSEVSTLGIDAETAKKIEHDSPPAVELGCLEVLSLGKMEILPEVVKMLTCKFANTLRDLQLWDLAFDVSPEEETQNIKALFRELISHEPCPDLTHFKFGRIYYTHHNSSDNKPPSHGRVFFGTRHEKGKMTIEYEGPVWRSFLAENIQTLEAIVEAPPPMDYSDENTDDSHVSHISEGSEAQSGDDEE